MRVLNPPGVNALVWETNKNIGSMCHLKGSCFFLLPMVL